MMSVIIRLLLLATGVNNVISWSNGLVTTPPMGWANWNTFGCNYNDTTIRQQAKAMVDLGLKDVGYEILIIQECIVKAGDRNASGILQPDPIKFPYGIPNLVDYIHSLGLKAGIYTDVGPETCAGYEGSYNHEVIDAKTFADWGIDFIEEDSCHHPTNYSYEELYTRMHNAIEASGKQMIFYMCVQGQDNVVSWGQNVGHLWRTTGDICGPGHATYQRMINNFYGNAQVPGVTGPSHWQDPDMMVVGMSGLTEVEWITHFSLWAISAAPMWIGIDLTIVEDNVVMILNNTEVIAVDQDNIGNAGIRVNQQSSVYNIAGEIWWKVLDVNKGEMSANAVILFNPTNKTVNNIGLGFNEIGLNGPCYVRDLWKHKDLGTMTNYSANIVSHGVVMLRVSQ
eukprot:326186_1